MSVYLLQQAAKVSDPVLYVNLLVTPTVSSS